MKQISKGFLITNILFYYLSFVLVTVIGINLYIGYKQSEECVGNICDPTAFYGFWITIPLFGIVFVLWFMLLLINIVLFIQRRRLN